MIFEIQNGGSKMANKKFKKFRVQIRNERSKNLDSFYSSRTNFLIFCPLS